MEQVKAMIFNYINKNNLKDEELHKLLFGIAKETGKTKAINYICWLYLNNNYDTFKDILEDILQEATTNYYTDTNTAYKNTMNYIYRTYTRQVKYHTKQDINDITVATNIANDRPKHYYTSYQIITDTKEQKDYYNELVERTEKNLEKAKRVFIGSKQKPQTINKLQKLKMIV